MTRRRKALEALYDERTRLGIAMIRDTAQTKDLLPHPHTQGMYDGINFAISVLEGKR